MPDYPIVQTAVYDVLLKLPDYNADNVSEDDYRILGNAGIAKGVVLTRGNSGNSQSGQQDILGGDRLRFVRRDDWVVNIELFVPIQTDVLAARASIAAEMKVITDHFDTWPALDQTAGILGTGADQIGEPDEWEAVSADMRWFRQVIQLNVEAHTEVLVNETVNSRIFRWGADGVTWGGAGVTWA